MGSTQSGMTNTPDPRDTASLIQACRDIGAIDLDRTTRTIGYERRPLSPDRRPTAAPSWGYAPQERDA
jgi:hypothetical protein